MFSCEKHSHVQRSHRKLSQGRTLRRWKLYHLPQQRFAGQYQFAFREQFSIISLCCRFPLKARSAVLFTSYSNFNEISSYFYLQHSIDGRFVCMCKPRVSNVQHLLVDLHSGHGCFLFALEIHRVHTTRQFSDCGYSTAFLDDSVLVAGFRFVTIISQSQDRNQTSLKIRKL